MDNDTRLARLLDGSLSEKETAQLKSDGDYELYRKIAELSAELTVPAIPDEKQRLAAILASQKTRPKQIPLYRNSWFRLAAAAVLVVAVAVFYVRSGVEQVVTGDATALDITLPDASEVNLANHSKLNYNSATWKFNRELTLSGEGFFNVAKGQLFTVHTSTGDVKVLGTKFNVNNRNNGLEVQCFEGRVEISNGDQRKVITARQSLRLAGNQLVIDSLFISRPVWKDSTLVFSSATLDAVISELEKTYQVGIEGVFARTSADSGFTGAIPSGNLGVAIEIIEKAFSVRCEKIAAGRYRLVY